MAKKMSSLVRKILSEVGRNENDIPTLFIFCKVGYPFCISLNYSKDESKI